MFTVCTKMLKRAFDIFYKEKVHTNLAHTLSITQNKQAVKSKFDRFLC